MPPITKHPVVVKQLDPDTHTPLPPAPRVSKRRQPLQIKTFPTNSSSYTEFLTTDSCYQQETQLSSNLTTVIIEDSHLPTPVSESPAKAQPFEVEKKKKRRAVVRFCVASSPTVTSGSETGEEEQSHLDVKGEEHEMKGRERDKRGNDEEKMPRKKRAYRRRTSTLVMAPSEEEACETSPEESPLNPSECMPPALGLFYPSANSTLGQPSSPAPKTQSSILPFFYPHAPADQDTIPLCLFDPSNPSKHPCICDWTPKPCTCGLFAQTVEEPKLEEFIQTDEDEDEMSNPPATEEEGGGGHSWAPTTLEGEEKGVYVNHQHFYRDAAGEFAVMNAFKERLMMVVKGRSELDCLVLPGAWERGLMEE
ncbi:hypothetical protein HDV05_000931 [Chytridiales sp. JEL 0842]|nr:hypothetical protein HDV05_000931 [Chytridiales sp. JEL 0842]